MGRRRPIPARVVSRRRGGGFGGAGTTARCSARCPRWRGAAAVRGVVPMLPPRRPARRARTGGDGEGRLDVKEGALAEPKSRAGRRPAPLASILRGVLLQHRLRQGRGGQGVVFGRTADSPFICSTVRARALLAWKAAKLQPIGGTSATPRVLDDRGGREREGAERLHGPRSVTITFDRYGDLMPGNLDEAAGLLDACLGHTAVIDGGPAEVCLLRAGPRDKRATVCDRECGPRREGQFHARLSRAAREGASIGGTSASASWPWTPERRSAGSRPAASPPSPNSSGR
jgi:hypothetical protein